MNGIPSLLLFVGIAAGNLIAGLLIWHTLIAIVRLTLAWYLPHTIDLLLERLSAATRAREPWEPVLRSLRLCLPWPWPWRLEGSARQLSAGLAPADLLRFGSLLPKVLRTQAGQALSQGPEAFTAWCASVRSEAATSTILVRHVSFLLAELTAVAVVTYFMTVIVFPKFEQILREYSLPAPSFMVYTRWLEHYGMALVIVILLVAVALAAVGLALLWRRKKRHAAACLLLSGCQARLPEAALSTDSTAPDGSGIPHSFAELCAASGWQADSPLALTRAVNRAEIRGRRMAAWLPAVFAALGPLLLAIPVGALVLGTMQILITIMYQIETSS